MRYEFTIALEHVDGVLRIKPCGEFDRGAAKKLLEVLRRQQIGEEPLIIDTTELGKVHTAACSLFKEGVRRFQMVTPRVRFIGCKGRAMTFDRSLVQQGGCRDTGAP
ncbi:MAG: hypothetical protein EA399_12915 [Desulfovibrionales bacterium]|nr:MAG: hypothetical protein EA399_12915 [Desulfovibrionales bacterium]